MVEEGEQGFKVWPVLRKRDAPSLFILVRPNLLSSVGQTKAPTHPDIIATCRALWYKLYYNVPILAALAFWMPGNLHLPSWTMHMGPKKLWGLRSEFIQAEKLGFNAPGKKVCVVFL